MGQNLQILNFFLYIIFYIYIYLVSTPAPSPGTVVSAINCNFESSSICNYVQDKTDVFDWTRQSRGTASSNTGPSNDHTYGTSRGQCQFNYLSLSLFLALMAEWLKICNS